MRRAAAFFIAPLFLLSPLLVPLGAAAASTSVFPSVSGGGFGKTPTMTFPQVSPPTSLESKVLLQGSGPVVKKGDLLIANYVGQIWRGKVFDSSFSRNELAAFPIGLGDVIPGWDKTLVGVRADSRLEIVIPPADGYGAKGNTGAGITGSDTLAFVVDVVGSFSKSAAISPKASGLRASINGVDISGPLGKPATVHVTKGAAQPSKVEASIIAKGSGPKVKPGLVVLQYVVVDWTNKVVESTWTTGFPDGEVVGNKAQASPLDPLVGLPLGSRVLLEIPKNADGGPFALSVDIVAEPTSP